MIMLLYVPFLNDAIHRIWKIAENSGVYVCAHTYIVKLVLHNSIVKLALHYIVLLS